MARRRSRGDRGARWLSRFFWLGVAAFAAWFSVERVAVPYMSDAGFRQVERHAEVIRAAAREFDLDPNLLAGIALAESSGRIDAVSEVGALGLFQLMLPTARERAELLDLPEPDRHALLTDAALNARLAASYLRWLSDRYDEHGDRVLAAYNAGPGRLEGWIREWGSYDAWHAARASESPVIAYARKVRRYRDRFAERGVIEPPQPAASGAPPALASTLPPPLQGPVPLELPADPTPQPEVPLDVPTVAPPPPDSNRP